MVYNHKAEGSHKDIKIDVELVSPGPNPDGTDGTDGFSDRYDILESEKIDTENKVEYSVREIKEKENTVTSPKPSVSSAPSAYPPKCYRCDFSNYHTKGEYDYHCVTRHPGLPGYPGPADIRESCLTPQGMSWEI